MVIFLKIGRLGFFNLSWIGFFVIYIWLIDWLIVIIFFFFLRYIKIEIELKVMKEWEEW